MRFPKLPKITVRRSEEFFEVFPLTPEQRHERDLASYQYEQEFYRHVATLSTGAIVILTTFLEKLAANVHSRGSAKMAIVAFAVSVISAVAAHGLSVLDVSRHPTSELGCTSTLLKVLIVFGLLGGFLAGILSLVLFAVGNL